MRTTLIVAALVFCGCHRANAKYCDDATPCASGLSCDLVARECRTMAVDGGSSDMAVPVMNDMAGCTCANPMPICVSPGTCVSCLATSDGEGACAATSSSTPHCNVDGTCVGCRDASDCAAPTPYCDSMTHACRGCIADTECPSLICDLTPGSMTRGQCVPISQVEYVDKNAATNGNGLSPTTPRQGLQDAINHATGGDNRPYVHVAAGSYNENAGVNNKAIYLVGADGAVVAPTNGDALGVMGNGAMTVRNVVASATNGNGVNCSTGKFTAYRSQFVNNNQSGVFSGASCTLKLDGCWLSGNHNGGIITDGQFTIINSIIASNTGDGGLYQRTNTSSPLVFANNTVADNTSGLSPAGVNCAVGSALTVADTILWNNMTTGIGIKETNCTTSYVASDDPVGGPTPTVPLSTTTPPGFKGTMPLSPDTYHLTSASPCLDKGHTPVAYDHDYDFAPRPDTRTGKPDIGATELQ